MGRCNVCERDARLCGADVDEPYRYRFEHNVSTSAPRSLTK
jgi:hypothetical protein